MDDAAPRADIFVTATGNVDVITIDHMRAMKHRAIVCNIGHFDSEIQVAALRNLQVAQRQAAGRRDRVPRRQAHHPAVGGPAGEPRQRHRPSELRHVGDASPTRRWRRSSCSPSRTKYEKQVYTLPKELDEKVARLHLAKIGVKLTELSDKQAAYIGVAPGRARSSPSTTATDTGRRDIAPPSTSRPRHCAALCADRDAATDSRRRLDSRIGDFRRSSASHAIRACRYSDGDSRWAPGDRAAMSKPNPSSIGTRRKGASACGAWQEERRRFARTATVALLSRRRSCPRRRSPPRPVAAASAITRRRRRSSSLVALSARSVFAVLSAIALIRARNRAESENARSAPRSAT